MENEMHKHECCPEMMMKHHDMMMQQEMMIKTGDKMSDGILKIADRAWESLLIDKMKIYLEKQDGKMMDKVAAAAVDTARIYYMNMMKGKMDVQMSANKIHEALISSN